MTMEDAKRWRVTYTKHVKQKRKVYQDGYLEFQSSRNKILLYNECEKLLETRFLKKEDVINSGETVAFDSYLVDIGDQCEGNKSNSNLNCQDKDKKANDKLGTSYRPESQNNSISVAVKPTFGKNKARAINLSPSQKVIREFKKSEFNKYSSSTSPSCLDMTEFSTTEWQVLYTNQITQKAKKFHDGFLRLKVHGSQGRQEYKHYDWKSLMQIILMIMLYDTARKLLDSRFLKNNEAVNSGESLAFEGHLVDIGEQEGDHKPLIDLSLRGKNHKVIGKADAADNQAKIPTYKKFHAGKPQGKTSPGIHNGFGGSSYKVDNTQLCWRIPANQPRRAAHEILSILKKPMIQEKNVALNNPLQENHIDSHSSDVHSDIKHCINDHVQECNGSALDEFREETSIDDCSTKILRSEATEILNDAEKCRVFENDKSQTGSSTSCLGSGATNYTTPNLNVEGANYIELMSTSPAADPQILGTPLLNSKGIMPITPASPIISNKNVELENNPQIILCKENSIETTVASTIDLSSNRLSEFCEENEGASSICHDGASIVCNIASTGYASCDPNSIDKKTLKQDFNANEMDEFPSFDLGF